MDRRPRNNSLLAQLATTNPFRELAQSIFNVGSAFEKSVADVGQDGRLSPQGKRERAQSHLAKARADLLELQKQVDINRAQTASLQSEMKSPVYDRADVVAALGRQELRAASRAMTSGQRAAHLAGPTRSKAFVDATMEFADDPWMSGVDVFNPNELELYEAAKAERLRDLNGPLVTALEARASVESEILMIVNMVKNDLEADAEQLAATRAA
jgi:hypothetical protein